MAFINKYDAAVRFKLSPELLEWMSRYAVKQGNDFKLASAVDEYGVLGFEDKELIKWDSFLWEPWPNTQRVVPEGIYRELMVESRGQCGFCTASLVGEIAHIDPWEVSYCHHPLNLIYLCPTCHTRSDRTKEIKKAVLQQRKNEILERRIQDWRILAKNHAQLCKTPPPKSSDEAIRTLFKINYSNAVAQKPIIATQFVEATGFTNIDSIPGNYIEESVRTFGKIYGDYFPTASGSFTSANSSLQESKNWNIRCGRCGQLYPSGFNVPRQSLFGNRVQCPSCGLFNDASYFNVLDPASKG